jgi:hypothetical protein
MAISQRLRFFATLSTGILIGVGLTAACVTYFRADRPERRLMFNVFHPDPAQWLFPPDFHIDGVISDSSALQAVRTPDRVTIHQRCKASDPDSIKIKDFYFCPQGTEVSGDRRTSLLDLTRSISAYGPPSICIFEPGVLMRCERSGYTLDLLFCFSCNDVFAFAGKDHDAVFSVGISDLGRRLFLQYFTLALPKATELQNLYHAYNQRNNG